MQVIFNDPHPSDSVFLIYYDGIIRALTAMGFGLCAFFALEAQTTFFAVIWFINTAWMGFQLAQKLQPWLRELDEQSTEI